MNAKTLNRLSNLALAAAAVYFAATLIARFALDDERVGRNAEAFSALDRSGVARDLPARGRPSVLVFWATWCGPCAIELGRLQAAIDDGEIPADRVFAVSLGEDPDVVFQHAAEKKYTFPVLADEARDSGRLFQVQATPTTLHVDEAGTIRWAAVGAHPLSVSKAKDFLRRN